MFKLLTVIHYTSTLSLVRRTTLLVLLTLLIGIGGFAQSSTDGTTPSGLTPGAPAGSYPLSGFDNVNLYNGNLNFHLPLLTIGGRGKASYTMTQVIDSKLWTVNGSSETHSFEIVSNVVEINFAHP